MTSVPPPTASPLPMAVQAPQAPVVMILAPPPAVAALAAGTPLEGVVEKSGSPDPTTQRVDVSVRTNVGEITLKLPAPLPEGAVVDLQIVRPNPDQTAVRLIAVNDQPATQILNQALAQLRQNPPPATPLLPAATPDAAPIAANVLAIGDAWTPQGPLALPQLGTFSALVLTAPLPPAPRVEIPSVIGPSPAESTAPAVAPQAFSLINGATLAVRVATVTTPDPAQEAATPAPATSPSPLPPQTMQTPTAALAPPSVVTSQVPSTVTAPVADGGESLSSPAAPGIVTAPGPSLTQSAVPQPTAPVLLIVGREGLPPAPPAPPTAVAAPPAQAAVAGTVVSATPDVPPVIATELGQIQLNVRANLPIGTRLMLEIAEQLPPEPGAPPPSAPMTSLPLATPTTAWPNLSEAMTLLERADPPMAAQLAEAIPDGGPRTALAIVAFVQAMRSGDVRQWPGETNLRALERTGPRGAHLANQLSDEVGALSSRARETGTEWRALPIPWNAEGRIDRILLITRREGDNEPDAKATGQNGGTRFLITLDLSRLGPMQLDGMFRRTLNGLDMIMRTKVPLPEAMRLDLTGIFAASAAAMGLKGGLAFQVVKTFPDPLARVDAAKPGVWA